MTPDEIIERGRDIQEMKRSRGWLAVVEELDREIKDEEDLLRRIDTADRSAEQVGAEYIARTARIAGLKRTTEIAEGMIEDMTRETAKE